MAKPMTSEAIETELEKINAGPVLQHEADVMSELRQAFTIGQDNGEAIILERASSLMADSVDDAQAMQLGRAVKQILAWCALVKARSWAPQSTGCLLFAGEEGSIDPESTGTGTVRFCYGADASESIVVAATWCTEHMKNSAPKVPDTLPAPADESHLAELAENGAASDAWQNTHGDTEAFGGSDF